MEAEDKAHKLVFRYFDFETDEKCPIVLDIASAKHCALIAVDEIIKTNSLGESPLLDLNSDNLHYWEKVREEIEKL